MDATETNPLNPETEFAVSADGTRIAFSRAGSGPVLVLVDGALCHRDFGPSKPFTKELQDSFTVVSYDRRGRGESEGGLVDSPQPEIDDLRAVIAAVRSDVSVLSFSSGGGIAFRAAAAGAPMKKLVAYETPFVGRRKGRDGATLDYVSDLKSLLSKGEKGKMVDYFMVKMVGAPFFLPVMFRLMGKTWKQLQGIAPTLLNDTQAMGGNFEVPVDVVSRIRIPVLVAYGSKAAAEMVAGQKKLAAAIPGAELGVLEKQTHNVAPPALRPELVRFFG